MLGRATLTIEASSRVINPAASKTPSAIHRCGSGRYSSWRAGAGPADAAAVTDMPSPGASGRVDRLFDQLHEARLVVREASYVARGTELDGRRSGALGHEP